MPEGGERRKKGTGGTVSWEPKEQGRTNRGQAWERPLEFRQKAVSGDLVRGVLTEP